MLTEHEVCTKCHYFEIELSFLLSLSLPLHLHLCVYLTFLLWYVVYSAQPTVYIKLLHTFYNYLKSMAHPFLNIQQSNWQIIDFQWFLIIFSSNHHSLPYIDGSSVFNDSTTKWTTHRFTLIIFQLTVINCEWWQIFSGFWWFSLHLFFSTTNSMLFSSLQQFSQICHFSRWLLELWICMRSQVFSSYNYKMIGKGFTINYTNSI